LFFLLQKFFAALFRAHSLAAVVLQLRQSLRAAWRPTRFAMVVPRFFPEPATPKEQASEMRCKMFARNFGNPFPNFHSSVDRVEAIFE